MFLLFIFFSLRSGIMIFLKPNLLASLTIFSQCDIGLTSPVSPISPTTIVLSNFIALLFTLESSAIANPKSPEVPSKFSPPTTLT